MFGVFQGLYSWHSHSLQNRPVCMCFLCHLLKNPSISIRTWTHVWSCKVGIYTSTRAERKPLLTCYILDTFPVTFIIPPDVWCYTTSTNTCPRILWHTVRSSRIRTVICKAFTGAYTKICVNSKFATKFTVWNTLIIMFLTATVASMYVWSSKVTTVATTFTQWFTNTCWHLTIAFVACANTWGNAECHRAHYYS